MRLLQLLCVLLCGVISFASRAQPVPLNLNDPVDNLLAFIKIRGNTEPSRETVFLFEGTAYSYLAENGLPLQTSNRVLFRFIGFNVARMVPTSDGWQQLSREIFLYRDSATGEILTCWNNPLNGKRVSVVQVANDPVNFRLVQSSWSPAPFVEANGQVVLGLDILLAFPNPLPPATYPTYSAGPLYQQVELFNYSTERRKLDTRARSVSAEASWTRVGQWLPWMQMGQAPGDIVYQGRGIKLRDFAELPQVLRDYVDTNFPAFRHAPTVFTTPNQSTWTYFKQLVDRGEYSPTCP